MRLSLLLFALFPLMIVGCQSFNEANGMGKPGVVPPQIEPEPRTVLLSEMAARLGWSRAEAAGAYAHAIQSPTGDRLVFEEGSDVMVMNNMYWRFERDAVTKHGSDLLLPESVFDFVARHFGREDLVRGTKVKRGSYELEPLTPRAEASKPQKAIGNQLKGWTICIDAGHGGKDPGGAAHGVSEKQLCLNVALRLQKLCEGAGAKVLMTRTADIYPELDERVALANDNHADLFVSIHANISPSDESVTGTETFYNENSPISQKLAAALVAAVVKEANVNNRGARKDPRGLRVLTKTKMPATLVELGFLSNKAEAMKLNSRVTQDKMADALFSGLVKFTAAERKPVVSR